MKKRLILLLVCLILCTGLIAVFNIPVITRQGINYKWQDIKIPLYLKILDFFDRHYNYKVLVKRITKDAKSQQEKVMRVFIWTYQNIQKPPKGMPLMDDHVWYTIVRGYGTGDQQSDVFTALCNYAGVEAFYTWVYNTAGTHRIALSFVKIDGKWTVFDPYYGVYFTSETGELAGVESIKAGQWKADIQEGPLPLNYADYLSNVPAIESVGLNRSNIQSPVRRFLYEMKKVTDKKRGVLKNGSK